MMGVSHVTLNLATDENPRVSVSLFPDVAARIQTRIISCGTPVLMIQHGDTEVRLWPYRAETINGDDVTIARRLVDAATAYLEICEHIHAGSSTT